MTRSPRRLREQVRDTVSELPIHAARLAVMGVGRALLLTDRVRKDYREARESGLGPVLGRLKDDAENIAGNVVGKVSGNGKAEETAGSATDSEISVGKPKPAASPRPAAPRPKPATTRPSQPAATSRPKPAPTPKPAATSKPAAAAKPSTAKPAAKPRSTAQTKPTAQAKRAPEAKAGAPAKAGPEAKAGAPAKAGPQAKTSAQAKAGPATTSAKPKAAEKPAAAAKPRAKATTSKDLPVTGYDEATLASVRARLRGLDARQVGELRDYERSHAARADFLRMYENRIAKMKGDH
jgi:outer membrane biosynthesis protein TonB